MTSAVDTRPAGSVGLPRRSVWDALNERLALSSLAYPVPEHANGLPYVLGGITLVGFLILVASGAYLAQFYHPHPDSAHGSVIYIVTRAPFGDVVRSIHFWTANLVTLTVILHMLRVFTTASYKRPREVNWLVGVGLLAATLGFVFTGTVLKWDQEGVEALGHNVEIGQLLGSWGAWFTNEFTLSVPILTRLFLGHVTLLPGVFAVLVIAHVYLIKQLGISPRAAGDARSGPPSAGQGTARFTEHLRKMAGYGLLLLAVVIVLALFAPAPLGNAGVPGAEVTKPPWMFLPIYPLEDVLGIRGLLLGSGAVMFLLVIVPFVDRSPWLSPRRRKWIVGIAALILVALVASGGYAWLSRPAAHLMESVP